VELQKKRNCVFLVRNYCQNAEDFKVVKYCCKIFEEVDVIYLGEIRDSFDVKWCFACASLLVYA
jgi:hypothetical protein